MRALVGFLVKRQRRRLQGDLQESQIKTNDLLLQNVENHQTMATLEEITMACCFGQNQYYYQQNPAS